MALHATNADGNRREYADDATFDASDMTAMCWCNPVSIGQALGILSRGIGHGGSNNGDWGFSQQTTDGQIRLRSRSSGGSQTIEESGFAMSVDTWYPIVGIRNATANDLAIHTRDGPAGTMYESNVATTGTYSAIAQQITTHEGTFEGGWGHGDIRIAYVVFWDEVLDLAETQALRDGLDPVLVRPHAIRVYDPCFKVPVHNWFSTGAASDVGTTTAYSPHPPVRRANTRLVLGVPGAAGGGPTTSPWYQYAQQAAAGAA